VSTAGVFGVAFSVNSLKNFAVGVIETGAHIGDLSEKLGVSAEAVQRFQYAAEQSGATIETVDRAIKAMNVNLATGNDSTVKALEEAGLRFDDIRRMAPEDAFVAIADAVAGIEDPMVRAKVATELFGKAGQELLPTFLAGIEEIGAKTRVMSDETIARLKAAEDAWSRLSNTITIVSGEAIAETFRMTESWKDFLTGLVVPSWLRPMWREAMADIGTTGLQAASEVGAMVATVTPGLNYLERNGLKPVALSAKQAEAEIAYMNATITKAPAAIALVEPKLGSLASFIREQKTVTDEWNGSLRFTSEVIGDRVVPEIEKLEGKIASVSNAMTAATGGAAKPAGSVGVNLGNLQFQNLDAAFAAYAARYGAGGVGVGMIGGGPAPDFISWARSMGLAQAAPTVNNTFNIVDTESGIASRIGTTITGQLQQGSMLN
jgi:hypothetical protein